ncbi:unnamed protein product [Haemonchus placei]|uniref:Uncharacterized protein n=1 Tax=Haemonchus placei TaxID=6290 RepID=A0A3P7V422_HAEPC|nr:unnamed protein product [Haemonchus placei]
MSSIQPDIWTQDKQLSKREDIYQSCSQCGRRLCESASMTSFHAFNR